MKTKKIWALVGGINVLVLGSAFALRSQRLQVEKTLAKQWMDHVTSTLYARPGVVFNTNISPQLALSQETQKTFGYQPTTLLLSKFESTSINALLVSLGIVVVVFLVVIVFLMHRHKQNRVELELVAYIDPVTNRGNFNKLKRDSKNLLFKHYDQIYALVSIDVNKFKVLNDIYGYEKGNQILKQIGDVIAKHLRNKELFSRMVSDHFTLLMTFECEDIMNRRLNQITNEIYRVIDLPYLKISVGIYVITDPTIDFSLMNDRANMAKKISKQGARKEYIYYRDEMRETVLLESELEGDMRLAMENKEFESYLQPKYSLMSGEICGAEALVRWNHKFKGFLQPNYFIPLFEQNGFIIEIDYFVLDSICEMIARWLAIGKEPYPISVNLSRLHMQNEALADELMAILDLHGVPARYIELELTETTIDLEFETIIPIFMKLKAKGFLIAIDDFGSGYSSLKLLKDIPADILKIDRDFFDSVKTSDREKIVIENVIRMAGDLDILVVSEGVETKEQADFLTSVGCEVVQGYYFARPMGMQEFEELVFKGVH